MKKNPYVALYKNTHELLMNTEISESKTPFVQISPSMRIGLVAESDRRAENLPTFDEVAGIIPNEHNAEGFRYLHLPS